MFFIVLDLRLTKVGVQRYSFFYALSCRWAAKHGGTEIQSSFSGLSSFPILFLLHAPTSSFTYSILNMFHSLHTVIPNECEESVAAVRVHPPPERPFALPVKPVHLLSSRTQLWNLFPLALPFRQAFFLLRSARAERCPKISSMPKYSIFNDRSALAERKRKVSSPENRSAFYRRRSYLADPIVL